MDNIAKGFGRGGNAGFIQFLEISHGSACETQSQLYRVLDRKYIQQEVFEELYNLVNEIKKMLLSLIKYLQVLNSGGLNSRTVYEPKTQNLELRTQN
jgi:four helix bundle protein